jgi:hypothetical protein
MSSGGVTLEIQAVPSWLGLLFPGSIGNLGEAATCNRQLIHFRDRSVYGK